MDTKQLQMVDKLVQTQAGAEVFNSFKKILATELRNETPLVKLVFDTATRLTDTTDPLLEPLGMVDRYSIAGVAGAFLQILKTIKKEG